MSALPSWTPWAVTGVALLALAVAGARSSTAPVSRRPVVRASLELPGNMALNGARISISADGSTVALAGTVDGRRAILARRLDHLDFFAVQETEGGDQQFLSPDGSFVVFRAGGMMRRVPLTGGSPVTLDREGAWVGGDWGPEGTVIYSRSYRSGLWRLDPEGVPELLTEPAVGELAHWWPQLLPDGEHVLFTAFRTPVEEAVIAVLSLRTGKRTDVLKGAVHGRYVPTGHLLFARGEALYAVPFDLGRLQTAGQPAVVVSDVAMEHPSGLAGYDISADGTLVYLPASAVNAPSDLVWVDRTGREEAIPVEPGRYTHPSLSPDGRLLAVALAMPGHAEDVWILDLVRGTRSRLGAGGGADFSPVWSPAGDRLIYVSERPVFDLYWGPADGSTQPAQLVASEFDKYPGTFTPDGRTMLYSRADEPRRQLWQVSLETGETSRVYSPDFNVTEPVLSPDGQWLAYASAESGLEQVYLASFPDLSRVRRQVSVRSGQSPLWTRSGRELVYVDGGRMMSVTVDLETGQLGRPETLFEGPYTASQFQNTRNYDVTPDGERFLMVKRPADRSARHVIIVTGFLEELRALSARDRS